MVKARLARGRGGDSHLPPSPPSPPGPPVARRTMAGSCATDRADAPVAAFASTVGNRMKTETIAGCIFAVDYFGDLVLEDRKNYCKGNKRAIFIGVTHSFSGDLAKVLCGTPPSIYLLVSAD